MHREKIEEIRYHNQKISWCRVLWLVVGTKERLDCDPCKLAKNGCLETWIWRKIVPWKKLPWKTHKCVLWKLGFGERLYIGKNCENSS